MSETVAIRAHGPVEGKNGARMGKLGVLGVRREDKNKWERRAPLSPENVSVLVQQGIKVIVQPSSRRIFNDEEYMRAGAVISDDLTECSTICAVKEVPMDLLLPGRTWLFFSHTIKAQPSGMPLLDAAVEKKVRLIDYECITSTGQRGGPRLVAFGTYAGYAGAIDFLRGMGERFLALGFSTPLLAVGSSFMYQSLDEARRAVRLAGDAIASNGMPAALCPLTVVFTGEGNVSQGALEIFKLLPHEMVTPSDLATLCVEGAKGTVHKVYLCMISAKHMVRRKDGRPFEKEYYYSEPEAHESIFQDKILPHATVVVNGMYWDARFPKLFTQEDLVRHVRSGHDKLLGVCDITCDEDGSVPTKMFTSIEKPFFLYNALDDTTSESMDGPGVLFHAVDHLPSELPREATDHFGKCLLPFLPDLARGAQDVPEPIKGAIICENGAITNAFRYIPQLRKMNEQGTGADGYQENTAALRPHGLQAPPACKTLELRGHLFDSLLINKVCDLAEIGKARVQILNLQVGAVNQEESVVTLMVMAQSDERLESVVDQIALAVKDAKAVMRMASGSMASVAPPMPRFAPTGPLRSILVLGSGFVCGPLVEYLLRRAENSLTVASFDKKELDAFVRKFDGSRLTPEMLDIVSLEAAQVQKREALVRASDIIISLAPATLHVGIAKLAVKHKKHMVTASYVSPEMQALDSDAKAAGVLIINEVGLDPGIDHMSAMKMIDGVKAKGGRVVSFSSLCGGLPAPEVAGSNPIGYKFSWSPKGVLQAARNPSRYRENGKLVEVAGPDLLASAKPLMLNNAFAFDVLPNRDCTAFADLYTLADAPSFFRGTFRYRGFCSRMLAVARLGLLEPGPVANLKTAKADSCQHWLAQLLGVEEGEMTMQATLRSRLGDAFEEGAGFLSWLGLTGDGPLPAGATVDSPLDVISLLLRRSETEYAPGERDMVVMQHELIVQPREGGPQERHTATLVEFAVPNGETAMARTVGLTAAICAQLVLDEASTFGVGVQRPLQKEWYNPVLAKLEGEGIAMQDKVEMIITSSSL